MIPPCPCTGSRHATANRDKSPTDRPVKLSSGTTAAIWATLRPKRWPVHRRHTARCPGWTRRVSEISRIRGEIVAEARTWRIAVIPGDGIGQEVVPEGLRVLDRLAAQSGGRFALRVRALPLGLPVLPGDRPHDRRRRRWNAASSSTRSTSARSAGRACRTTSACGGCAWPSARASTSTPTSARSAAARRPEPAARRHRREHGLGRGPREQRGRVRRHRRAQPVRARAAARRSPSRPACSPRRAASGSSATPSTWRCTRKRKKVTSVTKSNAQQYGMVLWDEVFAPGQRRVPGRRDRAVAGRRDGGALRAAAGDARGGGRLATCSPTSSPTSAARWPAASGIAASANLNPERRFPSMFEPVHGSAPDIAGQGHRQSDRRRSGAPR